jgi:transposase
LRGRVLAWHYGRMSFQLTTEKDVERLRQAALLLEAENRRLVARVVELTRKLMSAQGKDAEELQLRLQELERQLAQRTGELFGRSSEKRPQREQDEGNKPEPPTHGHGPRAQPTLPTLEVEHTLEEPDKQCPKCGGALSEMKGCYEEAEEVDVVERRFVLRRHKRQKYRCGCGGCVETALGPPKLQAGGRYSVDFAVEVAVAKYLDHMPLERQVGIMEREGLVVDSQTLWDQIDALARLLSPAHEALHQALLSREILGGDETRWPLLGSKSQTRWHAWALCAPDAVVYRIQEGRDTEAARNMLQDFGGILMVDGLSTYESAAAGSGGKLTLVNCWMHARRKYVECVEAFPQAEEALEMIAGLYAVEREYKEGPESLERLLELRQHKSRPIIERLHQWACEQRALPQSALGQAIKYMSNRWTGLTRFLTDPRVPLDNGATERAMRGLALGRKNHYGSRSRRGTEVAALYYSLMETAKLCGVDPKRYLRDAALAALRGEAIPLPNQLAQPAAG